MGVSALNKFDVLGVIHKRRPQDSRVGRGSSKSRRPHLVQNLRTQFLDRGENHDSKKYKYILKLMIFILI